MFTEIRKENPFQEIIDQILENVQSGKLHKGDALPAERVMAESLGISRPMLREVLRALNILGVITTVHGGANYISENLENSMIRPLSILFRLNNSSVYQNQQLRAALEVECAILAARNCSPSHECFCPVDGKYYHRHPGLYHAEAAVGGSCG